MTSVMIGVSPTTPSAVSSGTANWSTAKPVPGIAALDRSGDAEANAVSCPAPGACVVAGNYGNRSHDRTASGYPPSARPWNTPPSRTSLSCPAPRRASCSAGGSYVDKANHIQPFVIDESAGRWDKARPIPGFAALNKGDGAFLPLSSLSCAAGGGCIAAGIYRDQAAHDRAFITTRS